MNISKILPNAAWLVRTHLPAALNPRLRVLKPKPSCAAPTAFWYFLKFLHCLLVFLPATSALAEEHLRLKYHLRGNLAHTPGHQHTKMLVSSRRQRLGTQAAATSESCLEWLCPEDFTNTGLGKGWCWFLRMPWVQWGEGLTWLATLVALLFSSSNRPYKRLGYRISGLWSRNLSRSYSCQQTIQYRIFFFPLGFICF